MGEQRMKNSYGKGRKRWLALLLCISMMATSVPMSARAEEVDNSFYYEAVEQENVKTIKDWQWIDENEILDEETGNLGLPGASKRTPAYFDDVVSLLPTQIEAVIAPETTEPQDTEAETTVPQEAEPLNISEWICENYPEEGAYEGTYVFTASLEEGYVLSESAKPLTVMVELGGAAMMIAYLPEDRVLTPGSSLNVSTIKMGNYTLQRYFMSTEGATYRIYGNNASETCARFCITKSCTVILENISLKTGVTFEEDGETYYYSGNQGIFSVADDVDVTFILKGKSVITNKVYSSNAVHIGVHGILLGEGSSVTIAGDGSLDLSGMIGRPYNCNRNARLIMKSGLLEVNGFGAERYIASTGSLEHKNEKIEIVYEGGSLFADADDTSAFEKHGTRYCLGDNCRVAINGRNYQNLTKMIYIKRGADGTFSKLCPTYYYTIYLWHKWKQAGEVIDYYVVSDRPNGGEYCHFRHTCKSKASDYLTEAVETQDKNSIGGAGGKVMGQGVPVENATVTFKSSFFTGSCTTDSDGAYYKAMPPGTYQVLVTAENNTYDVGSITITSETLHTFSFNLARVNGSFKTGNETTANVTLTFQNESSKVTVKTDEDGNYTLPVSLGTYQVSARLPGSDTVYALGTVNIVQADSYTCDYALFKLQGVVKDNNGKGIMKTRISVESKGKTFETVTDANGSYTLIFAPEDMTMGESFQIKAAYFLAGEKQETVICDGLGMTKNFTLDYADASTIEVYSEDDLVLIAENADGGLLNNKTIELMKDITLTGKFQGINTHASINGLTFKGNDHEIENMTTPLFLNGDAVSLSGSRVENLHLKGNIVNNHKYLGAIAGYSSGSTFYKCTFEGKIKSTAASGYIGGLGGYVKDCGKINHCGVRLTELAGGCDSYIGGLAGRLDTNLSLLNSYAVIEAFNGTTSSSSGTRTARGALVGKFLFQSSNMVVRNCYAVVKGGNASIYRMVGYETSWENNCIERATFESNYAYAPDGVFENDETSVNHAAALPDAVMKAAPGTTVGGEKALIDRLKETTSSYHLDWYQDSDGYPSLAPHRCTITYCGGAKGTGSQDSEKVILGKEVTLPGAVYKNTDYIQTGWTTSENGSKAYGLNAVITIEKNMTLYPYWQLKQAAPCAAPEGLTVVYGQLLREIALPEGFSWNEPDLPVGDVGTRSFTATYTPTPEEAETYQKNTNVSVSIKVNKAPSVYLLPVSKVENLTYNQAEQRLVTGGSTVCGTIVYSLAEEGEYKADIPTGKEVGDYTVYYRILGDSNHTDSAVGSIPTSIGRCDLSGAEITLGTALTYTGDEQTQNIAEVKVGEQILTAEDYTVTGNTATMAGNYTLTITGKGNYTQSAEKQYEIAQKAAAPISDIEKSYVAVSGSKGTTENIDIAALLPTDRGSTTYRLEDNDAVYVTEESVDTNGQLTYKVAGKTGTAGDSTTLTVTAATRNYGDITVKVVISLMAQYAVEEKEGAEVSVSGSNELTYGQELGTLQLNAGTAEFVKEGTNTSVEGTLAWKTPDDVLNAGTTSAAWIFTPSDDKYSQLEGEAAICVKKAALTVEEIPTVTRRIYDPSVKVKNFSLMGGKVTGINGVEISGIWSFADEEKEKIPTVNNNGYRAVFTPSEELDKNNYQEAGASVVFAISKADPRIGTVTADPGCISDTTAVSEVTIKRSNTAVAGQLKLDAEELSYGRDKAYAWTFTPADTNNYQTVKGSVNITVQDTIAPKAEYRIGENEWKKFINTISFGLFCKDYKTVEITCSDDNGRGEEGSGVTSVQYYISDSGLSEAEVSEVEWKNYTGIIPLDSQGVYFIYVKVTDSYGNCTTLNSEGIVIYEESTVYPESMDYTYNENKTLEIQVTANGNTLDKVTGADGTLLEGQDYVFEASTGILTLKAAYLDTLEKGEHSYRIHMKPQGQTTDEPALAYAFEVKVKAQELTVTAAEAESKVYDETGRVRITGVTLSGAKTGDSVYVDTTNLYGTVESKNAGKYSAVTLDTLTLAGKDAANYSLKQPEGAVPADVTIDKCEGFKVQAIDKNYIYAVDSTETIDFSKLLPADCGRAVYGTPAVTGDVTYKTDKAPAVSADGKLSYTVKTADTYGASGTIKTTVSTDNYEDFDITVNVKQTDKMTAALKEGATISLKNSTLTYGESLSKLVFNDAEFVGSDGKTVEGTLAWKTPADVPDVKTTSAAWVFTPEKAEYHSTEGTVAITVNQAEPKVSKAPAVADRTYHPAKALQDTELKGGEVLGVDGREIAGTWSFKDAGTVPVVKNQGYVAVFQPEDSSNYVPVSKTIAVKVEKATPYIAIKPEGSALNYGETLAKSTLTGGKVQYSETDDKEVLGSFSWKEADTKVVDTDSEKTVYPVVFTPSDADNYTEAETGITLKVNNPDIGFIASGGNAVTTGKGTSDSVITTSPTEVSVEGKSAIVTVKAANIEESIKQAAEYKSSEIVFGVSQKDTEKADSILCTLAKKDVSKIAEKTNAELVISTPAGDVQLSKKTMEKVTDAVQGDNLTIKITKVTEPTAEQKQAAGSHAYIVDVTIESAGKEITSFGGNKLTVKLEIPDSLLGKTVAVICIEEAGKPERMPGKRIRKGDKEYYEFTTEHLSTFALIDAAQLEKETNAEKNHKKGTLFTTKTTKMVYKVTKAGSTGGTVQFTGTKNKAAKTIRIPATVTFEGITYKVTSIAAGALKNNKTVTKVVIGKNVATIGTRAFSGCSNLKTIKVESTKLTGKSLSELSLKGISIEAVFEVPKKKIKTYKALFTKAGLNKKVKVTEG